MGRPTNLFGTWLALRQLFTGLMRMRVTLTRTAAVSKVITTETVVMRSATGTVRWIRAEHPYHAKFQPS